MENQNHDISRFRLRSQARRAGKCISDLSKPRVILNFNTDFQRPGRKQIADIVRRNFQAHQDQLFDLASTIRIEAWRIYSDIDFVLSPFGGGLDCHRTWEALVIGAIPIIEHSPGMAPLFDDLPVVQVTSWNDVTPANLKQWRRELDPARRRLDQDPTVLTSAYWSRKIYEATFEDTSSSIAAGGSQIGIPRSDLTAVLRSVSRNRQITLLTSSSGFIDFTHNLIISMGRVGVDNFVIVAEDLPTYYELDKAYPGRVVYPDLPPEVRGTVQSVSGRVRPVSEDYGSAGYRAMDRRRPHYLIPILEQGYDIMFTDVDIVWLEDVYNYVLPDYDMQIASDQQLPTDSLLKTVCAGFVFYRAKPVVIELMKAWRDRLDLTKGRELLWTP